MARPRDSNSGPIRPSFPRDGGSFAAYPVSDRYLNGALRMSDRVVNAVIFVGFVAIIGGSVAVMLSSGAPILSVFSGNAKKTPAPAAMPSRAPVQSAEPVVEPAQPTPVSAALKLEASQRMTPGVYRCQEDGRIIYASQPCVNGRKVESRHSDGSNATSVPKQSGQPAAR